MVHTLIWIILIIFPCIRELNFTTTTTSKPAVNLQRQTSKSGSPFSVPLQSVKNNGDLEYRVTRLEVLLEESNRRVQALEWKSAEISTLNGLCADLTRIVQQAPPSAPAAPVKQANMRLEQAVEDLHKDMQMLITTTTILTPEVNDLKKNVSLLINDTRFMLQSTSHFVTKQFLNESILNLQQQYPSFSIYSENPTDLPKNCREVKYSGQTHTGIYSIQPQDSVNPVSVFCDMQTRGGGWTVIQNRFDGSQDFYQNWQEYKHGFGNLSGEFWLGLDTIHQLTGSQANELLIELQDFDLLNKTAYYASFSVGPEREGFPLKILKGYCGDAGDSLTNQLGSKFTTKDADQDSHDTLNCADYCGGAWWYTGCTGSNLNGMYLKGKIKGYKGIFWNTFRGLEYSLLKTRMLVRPRVDVCDGF